MLLISFFYAQSSQNSELCIYMLMCNLRIFSFKLCCRSVQPYLCPVSAYSWYAVGLISYMQKNQRAYIDLRVLFLSLVSFVQSSPAHTSLSVT